MHEALLPVVAAIRAALVRVARARGVCIANLLTLDEALALLRRIRRWGEGTVGRAVRAGASAERVGVAIANAFDIFVDRE